VRGSSDGLGAGAASDGGGGEATFNGPMGLCVDPNDNCYVCDSMNGLIRKITPEGTAHSLFVCVCDGAMCADLCCVWCVMQVKCTPFTRAQSSISPAQ
jgi:hypothetical protein